VIACFGDWACDFSADSGPLEAQPVASIASNGKDRLEWPLTCGLHMAEFWLRPFRRGIRIYHRLVPGRVGESPAVQALTRVPRKAAVASAPAGVVDRSDSVSIACSYYTGLQVYLLQQPDGGKIAGLHQPGAVPGFPGLSGVAGNRGGGSPPGRRRPCFGPWKESPPLSCERCTTSKYAVSSLHQPPAGEGGTLFSR
jgi:hypothetical protein